MFFVCIHLILKQEEHLNLSTISIKGAAIGINNNWKFIVTATSIITSLISMAVVLTENYFAKPGRNTYKTPVRWIVFFSR